MGRNASHGSAGRPSCSPHVFADRLGCTFFFSTVSCSPVSIRWWGAGGVGLQEDTPFTEVGLGIHVPLPAPNSAPAAVNGRRLKFCVAITTFTTPALLSIFICWLFWWCFPAESNYACHDDGRNPSQDPPTMKLSLIWQREIDVFACIYSIIFFPPLEHTCGRRRNRKFERKGEKGLHQTDERRIEEEEKNIKTLH